MYIFKEIIWQTIFFPLLAICVFSIAFSYNQPAWQLLQLNYSLSSAKNLLDKIIYFPWIVKNKGFELHLLFLPSRKQFFSSVVYFPIIFDFSTPLLRKHHLHLWHALSLNLQTICDRVTYYIVVSQERLTPVVRSHKTYSSTLYCFYVIIHIAKKKAHALYEFRSWQRNDIMMR